MHNILYIAPYKYLKPQGGGHYCMYYTHQYLGKVSNLSVVSVAANDAMPNNNFNNLNILANSFLRYIDIRNFYKLKKIIQQQNIKILIIEHPYFAWLAYALKKSTGVYLIIRSENVEYLRFKTFGKSWWPLLKIYETWAHKKADEVWCITSQDKSVIQTDIKNAKTKLIDFPYGTEEKNKPTNKYYSKQQLLKTHQLSENTKILFFNGTLNYEPNRIGLDAILNNINPILLQQNINYKIIICGSKLPDSYNKLQNYVTKNIIYCGFVEDIATYFKGADIFINPIVGGGGIKTKLVEALAYNVLSISSQDGAVGINANYTGQMLQIIEQNNWVLFAEKIIYYLQKDVLPEIPDTFYTYYNWQNNIEKLIAPLNQNII